MWVLFESLWKTSANRQNQLRGEEPLPWGNTAQGRAVCSLNSQHEKMLSELQKIHGKWWVRMGFSFPKAPLLPRNSHSKDGGGSGVPPVPAEVWDCSLGVSTVTLNPCSCSYSPGETSAAGAGEPLQTMFLPALPAAAAARVSPGEEQKQAACPGCSTTAGHAQSLTCCSELLIQSLAPEQQEPALLQDWE